MHMEEIDLCWRLHRIGYGVYCCPQAVVWHVGGGTLPKEAPQKTFLNFRNNLLMLHKHVGCHRLCCVLSGPHVVGYCSLRLFLCTRQVEAGTSGGKSVHQFFKPMCKGYKTRP